MSYIGMGIYSSIRSISILIPAVANDEYMKSVTDRFSGKDNNLLITTLRLGSSTYFLKQIHSSSRVDNLKGRACEAWKEGNMIKEACNEGPYEAKVNQQQFGQLGY